MKQIFNFLLVAASFVTRSTLIHGASAKAAATAPKRDSKQAARLDWWREAKFRLFIHWGLSSVATLSDFNR